MTLHRKVTVTVALTEVSDQYDDAVLALALDTAMADAVLAFLSRYDLATSKKPAWARSMPGASSPPVVLLRGEQL